jgi:colanic acid/amylovoran biosynthesis glycosyltransferase
MTNKNPVVAQSMHAWMPVTTSWIYNHLIESDSVDSVILTRTTENLELFPWSPLYAMNRASHLAVRVFNQLGYRWIPPIYRQAIERQRPNILHSHFGDVGWYDMPLAQKHKLPHLVTFYGYDVNMLPLQKPQWRSRYTEMFAGSNLFLCEGPHMAHCLVELGCPPEKVRVFRLGVNVNKIEYKRRQFTHNEPLRILLVGTFREKKGIPYALQAIGQFQAYYPHIQVTIIGDARPVARELQEKKRIMQVIKAYNLESVTRLLGYQSYATMMAEAYQHHIFMATSVTASNGDTEGGAPVTIIDLMASGMPVIGSTHCDIPQIVKDGQTGLLAEEGDVAQIAQRLTWLVDNPDAWHNLTDNGRQHVEKHFNVAIQAKELAHIYQTLLK